MFGLLQAEILPHASAMHLHCRCTAHPVHLLVPAWSSIGPMAHFWRFLADPGSRPSSAGSSWSPLERWSPLEPTKDRPSSAVDGTTLERARGSPLEQEPTKDRPTIAGDRARQNREPAGALSEPADRPSPAIGVRG
jgi:hypothetical protein